MAMLRPAILLFILLALITGGLYPLLTTALGQWWFTDRANGSLILQEGEIRGSRLIGQNFTEAGYFQGRPSATAAWPIIRSNIAVPAARCRSRATICTWLKSGCGSNNPLPRAGEGAI